MSDEKKENVVSLSDFKKQQGFYMKISVADGKEYEIDDDWMIKFIDGEIPMDDELVQTILRQSVIDTIEYMLYKHTEDEE